MIGRPPHSLAFPPVQSSFSHCHSLQIPCQEKIRSVRPLQGSEEGVEEGVLCICQRASEQEGRTNRVGRMMVGWRFSERRGTHREEKSECWCQPILAQIGLGVAQKVIVRETRKGVDFRWEGGWKEGRELSVFLLQSFQLAARKVGSYSCHLAIAQRPFGAGRLSKSDANVTANAVSLAHSHG